MEKLSKVVGATVLIVAALAVVAIVRGLALSILWGWFIAPLGPPEINVGEAIGIALVVGMLTERRERREDRAGENWVEVLAVAFMQSLIGAGFALLIGLLVHGVS